MEAGPGPPQVPFRLWAAYAAFLVALGILLLFGMVQVVRALQPVSAAWARPALLLPTLLALAALASAAVVGVARLPWRLFWPSFAAVGGSALLAAALLMVAIASSGCGYQPTGASWRQPGLFEAMAQAGAIVEPPKDGWDGPWPNATVEGVAYAERGPRGGDTTGFYLRADTGMLSYRGLWTNGSAVELREMAERLSSRDPAPWAAVLSKGGAVEAQPLDRLPALLEELAAQGPLEPDGWERVGPASLSSGPWRLDLRLAVASLGPVRADAAGGAESMGSLGDDAEFEERDAAERFTREQVGAWMQARGLPFEPTAFEAHLAIC